MRFPPGVSVAMYGRSECGPDHIAVLLADGDHLGTQLPTRLVVPHEASHPGRIDLDESAVNGPRGKPISSTLRKASRSQYAAVSGSPRRVLTEARAICETAIGSLGAARMERLLIGGTGHQARDTAF